MSFIQATLGSRCSGVADVQVMIGEPHFVSASAVSRQTTTGKGLKGHHVSVEPAHPT
jgi:hypothetical protein